MTKPKSIAFNLSGFACMSSQHNEETNTAVSQFVMQVGEEGSIFRTVSEYFNTDGTIQWANEVQVYVPGVLLGDLPATGAAAPEPAKAAKGKAKAAVKAAKK